VTEATKIVTEAAGHFIEIGVPALDLEPAVAEQCQQRIVARLKQAMAEGFEHDIAVHGAVRWGSNDLVRVPFAVRQGGQFVRIAGWARLVDGNREGSA
jgi:hypothetical protein